MNLKAYTIRDFGGEGYCVLVFAETRSRARYIAFNSIVFETTYDDFRDYLRWSEIHRAKEFDKYAEKEGEFDFCEHADIFESEGWVCYIKYDCGRECIFRRKEGAE